jgi:signal transduction histidine kinase
LVAVVSPPMSRSLPGAPVVRPAGPSHAAAPAPADFAFLRFSAGIRALLALLVGTALMAADPPARARDVATVLPYMAWSALLLWRTLAGWRFAALKAWLWVDALALLVISHSLVGSLPLFGLAAVLPVVALATLAGAGQAMALSIATAGVMLALPHVWPELAGLEPLPVRVPLVVLLLGPAAAMLARPSRELRQRQQLIDAVQSRADPRQGLRHHAEVLLDEVARHFGLGEALLSLQGLEPRVFRWRAAEGTVELSEPESGHWAERLLALPRDRGCLHVPPGAGQKASTLHDVVTGQRVGVPDVPAGRTLERLPSPALALPLLNYGQPLGTLCLQRADARFEPSDLRWLHGVMHEAMPLLERSDLLEQLQRESAMNERERIGRDLHDSAVQPYLGLKYGLEALARQAGPDNPVHANVAQLVHLATEELQKLRDVVGGLRRGDDPGAPEDASLAALKREAQRFMSLYGLKVHIFAPDAPRLRGSAAKAVLHMVNETLTNVRRHTSATAVTLMLDVTPTDVLLRVRNDHGYREALPPAFLPRSLTERAAEFGGVVEVDHQPDFTEVRITLPVLGVLR